MPNIRIICRRGHEFEGVLQRETHPWKVWPGGISMIRITGEDYVKEASAPPPFALVERALTEQTFSGALPAGFCGFPVTGRPLRPVWGGNFTELKSVNHTLLLLFAAISGMNGYRFSHDSSPLFTIWTQAVPWTAWSIPIIHPAAAFGLMDKNIAPVGPCQSPGRNHIDAPAKKWRIHSLWSWYPVLTWYAKSGNGCYKRKTQGIEQKARIIKIDRILNPYFFYHDERK